MPVPLLEAAGLGKTYHEPSGPSTVLEDVSFTLGAGESLSLTGPSGSGKSTLLNILGLLDQPGAGRLLYNGEDAGTWTQRRREEFRGTSLGFVFQRHLLLPEFTLLENVSLPLARTAGYTKVVTTRAMELLDRMGIAQRAHALPRHLSGGEMQRGALCRALIHEPALVLMDEPTGNLDPALGLQVIRDVLELLRSRNMSCILVTHNFELAALTMRHGRMQDHRMLEGTLV